MSAPIEPWQPILDSFSKLHAAWPKVEWNWDPRIKCVACTIDAESVKASLALVTAAIPTEWTMENFDAAPEFPRTRCGDLRPGQKLMTGELVAGMMAYAIWWPWGDGSRVAVRIGIANAERPKELYPLFRALFGITPAEPA